METLIIVTLINGSAWLKDSNGHVIGRFDSPEQAEQWCKENGYRSRRK